MQFQTVIIALLQSASIAAAAAVLPGAGPNTKANVDRRAACQTGLTPAICNDVCDTAKEEKPAGTNPEVCADQAYVNYSNGCIDCYQRNGGDVACLNDWLVTC